MQLTHPDASRAHDYPYEAHDINVAYQYLLEHPKGERIPTQKEKNRKIRWNAPENLNAFTKRDIFQYYENPDGERLGTITIDSGRYLWIPDEEFSLFLLSLYQASKKITAESDARLGLDRSRDTELLAEITYLLAGQFFDSRSAMGLLSKDSSSQANDSATQDSGAIYHIDAMLELSNPGRKFAIKQPLYPMGVKNHRLYIRDEKGMELGYLSFKDDRLYYGIIPLFERKAVQVKMAVSNPTVNQQGSRKSIDVDLWIRLLPEEKISVLESINIQIEQLLEGNDHAL